MEEEKQGAPSPAILQVKSEKDIGKPELLKLKSGYDEAYETYKS